MRNNEGSAVRRFGITRSGWRCTACARCACQHEADVATSPACSHRTSSRDARRVLRARTRRSPTSSSSSRRRASSPPARMAAGRRTVPMIHTQLKAPVNVSVSQAGQTVPLRFPDDIYLGTVRPVDRVRDRQRADGVRRLWRDRAGARLGRFQGRRPPRQGRGDAGQRSRLRSGAGRAGRGQVRRQDDDLLRPLDLQI